MRSVCTVDWFRLTVPDVTGSNLSPFTDLSSLRLLGFPQSLEKNNGIVRTLK